ncbi:nucleolin 2 [Lactuca sativa]|uniref:nucleolin 2 n=1 Tax=Lactuca sativa TaxID=4236 RepID=UPI000CD9F3A4|nr:nucleolin 2 [Lactuca sativa]
MADFGAPSFSLGFDFDFSEPQLTTANESKNPTAPNRFSVAATGLVDDGDNDFETVTVVDSDTDNQNSPPKLKRLRRGRPVEDTVSSASVKSKADLFSAVVVDDDDIEDFSSPEDNHTDERHSTQHHSVYTSSKIPLNGHGILTKQSGKRKQNVSDDPESVITTCNKPPKITISPLRKFQLIDSDSDSDFDDHFINEAANRKTFNESNSYLNSSQPKKPTESTRKDLWEDFRPEKSFHIPTPVLDEVCDEYFNSMKAKKTPQSNKPPKNHVKNNIIDLSDPISPIPPAHNYFFHDDMRIQELVRSRLPNFFPLNATNRDCEQPGTSNIDYMGQFSRGESSKQASGSNKAETSSRKKPRKSKPQERSMNPKVNVPKDAGQRRVQADGKASGHWFTNGDGKRVYVSKNGEELIGRAAYILYSKERGGYKKNAKPKKKSLAKKK